MDGITDAYRVFVGAILRPNPKATLESTGSPLAGWDEMRTLFGKAVGWAVFIFELLLEQAPAVWGMQAATERMLQCTHFTAPKGFFLSISLYPSFLVVGIKCLGLRERTWCEVILFLHRQNSCAVSWGRLQMMCAGS